MSEKRFYLDEEDRLCIHYDGKILAGVGFSETEAEKIVDMLNQLNDENEKLRQQLEIRTESDKYHQRMLLKWLCKDE